MAHEWADPDLELRSPRAYHSIADIGPKAEVCAKWNIDLDSYIRHIQIGNRPVKDYLCANSPDYYEGHGPDTLTDDVAPELRSVKRIPSRCVKHNKQCSYCGVVCCYDHR